MNATEPQDLVLRLPPLDGPTAAWVLEHRLAPLIEATGAYTTSYSAIEFNGFPPLKAYYI